FAVLYLLSPPGQWAAMADFHTVAFAAPLLMLAVDALDAAHPKRFLLACLLAASTKEEIGLIVAGLGVLGVLRYGPPQLRWLRRLGLGAQEAGETGSRRVMCLASLAALVGGVGWSVVCVAVIIPHYSGGAISPFTSRYAELGGSPGAMLRTLVTQPSVYLTVLGRSEVLAYLGTLTLAGGWLALLAPELLLPVAPVLALNVLSNSLWMASGRAHYSASIVPLVVAGAIVGAGRLTALARRLGAAPSAGERAAGRWPGHALLLAVSLAAVCAGALAYWQNGIGPLVRDLPMPTVTAHARLAQRLAATIPPDATVSASTALYPHISQRAGAYLFPTLRDADYVFVDISGSPYPGEPGGSHQILTELAAHGPYQIEAAEDGLLLLSRQPAGTVERRPIPPGLLDFARVAAAPAAHAPVMLVDGRLTMLACRLVASGEVGPNGPLATLETIWRADGPLPERPRPVITVRFQDGHEQDFENLPVLWWYPPEAWQPGELVRIDVRGLALRNVVGWHVSAPADPPGSPGRR
ncbi:MAG: DUF2079 domain-containing protein, partial [Chloroflexota bacterium]